MYLLSGTVGLVAAVRLPAAATLGTHASQHVIGLTGDLFVAPLLHGRASLTLVGGRLLAPLASTDKGRVNTLRVDLACSLGADGEALARTQKALTSTFTKHNGTLMSLRGFTSPSSPWHSSTAGIASTSVSWHL